MLVVFMSLFFARNLMLPMASDDIPYAFVWDGEDRGNLLDSVGPRERITSFGDIVRSQYSHYMTWGGRIIGIGLTQLFAWEGKGLFNVLNTLVFTALTLLLFRVGTGKKLCEMNGVYMFWLLFALWTPSSRCSGCVAVVCSYGQLSSACSSYCHTPRPTGLKKTRYPTNGVCR